MVKSNKNKLKNNKKQISNKYFVYLDNASATSIDKNILSKMLKAFKDNFANPSSLHKKGEFIKNSIFEIRSNILKILNGQNGEIIFTSGATESNNLAILGIIENYKKQNKNLPHIIISSIEHSSIIELCKDLELNKKIELTILPVSNEGIVDLNILKKSIKKNTLLVSVMYANNEIGVVEPLNEIIKIIRHFRKRNNSVFPFLHSDITQALNYKEINLISLGVDMVSFNAAKIYGPKGIGVLYKRRNIEINSIMKGGEQEFGYRPGTENYPLILGLNEALIQTISLRDSENKRLKVLQKYFINKISNLLKKHKIDFRINGSLEERLPNNINITIDKIPSDLLLLELSQYDIYVSEKSACKSNEKKNSYVLEALYGESKESINSLRFSLGRDTKKEDLDYVISILDKVLKKLYIWYNS